MMMCQLMWQLMWQMSWDKLLHTCICKWICVSVRACVRGADCRAHLEEDIWSMDDATCATSHWLLEFERPEGLIMILT